MTMRRTPGQRRPAQASSRIAACLVIIGVAIVTTPGSLARASLAPGASAPLPVTRAVRRVTPPIAPDVCIAGRSDVRRLSAAFDHRGPGWAGADLTASVPLGDGRILWLFGDTFVGGVAPNGARAPGTLMVNNSAIVQTGNCFRPLLGGTPAAPAAWIAPAARDGSWYWPADAVVDGGRLHVLLMHVVDKGGQIGHVDGMHRATLRLPDLAPERVVVVPGSSQRHYGIGTSNDDAFVYLWGSAQRWRGSWDRAMFVARVPRGRLDVDRLEYWTGRRWSHDAVNAKPVVAEGLGHKVSVHPHHGGWLAVSKRFEFMSDDLAGWWAPTPEGPWKSLGRLLAVPRQATAGTFTYMGSAHPTLRQPDGRLLVAWNVNTFDLKALLADAFLYGPRFTLVTVPPVA